MQKSFSFEKINNKQVVSNVRNNTISCSSPNKFVPTPSKRRFKSGPGNISEHYSIIIKPKLHRSNSLCDLTTNTSDYKLDVFQYTRNHLAEYTNTSLRGCSGDNKEYHFKGNSDTTYMSWNFKGKKTKKKIDMSPESHPSKFSTAYAHNSHRERIIFDPTISSCAEYSSSCSTDHYSVQRGPAFPFKSTPSGNLKVQSNQVVFQSSTVGVLLADPTQAKVKVKFEGKPTSEVDEIDDKNESESQLEYGGKEVPTLNLQTAKNAFLNERHTKCKPLSVKEEKGKDLYSLGYNKNEPIDWTRVLLPSKQDLFQEFYRRIHNYINTDVVIHIDNEVFHCHRMVLQIYSNFFNTNHLHEIELPISNVKPESFHTIYEWMILNGPESNRALNRDNVLDLFCAAQYLGIKDLEDQCWSFIMNDSLFIEDTAFTLYRKARAKGITSIMDLMVPRVMRFFLPLVASKDFLDLELEEIIIFLKSNYICVTSEIEVLMAGVRWLHGDWTSRQEVAVEVMRCVRFGLISPWQLVDIKRNPDNAEILEIVNDPEVQQMVDDGLAYVIIKYWYGNNSKNYYHWIDVLGLSEPTERNWIGEEKNHVTYKDFLKYLEQFMVPKEQMFQQMAMMQSHRRNDDVPGSLRGADNNKLEMQRPKLDFPLPATLRSLAEEKNKSFPTMSEFFENRRKTKENCQSPSNRSPPINANMLMQMPFQQECRRSIEVDHNHKKELEELRNLQHEQQIQQSIAMHRRKQIEQIHVCTIDHGSISQSQTSIQKNYHCQMHDPPEKDSTEETHYSESSSTADTSVDGKDYIMKHDETRHSVAASYLAAATAALSGTRGSQSPQKVCPRPQANAPRSEIVQKAVAPSVRNYSPELSLFNQSKESLARINMNRLSTSILGPSNKNYIVNGSLFNWDRETVLVFGGIDPHTAYGVGRNTGKDIYRFDPVANVWDYVGDLPEPRHHHSVAFLRGRVYLVGGADPRDDDIRGKSVVVSTVWSYEPVTRSWYSESGLTIPRKNFGLVVHRMALYAIGGQDKKGRVLRSVEKFDPKTGSWSEMRSMGVARMAVATTKYRDYIWVAGGMTGEKKKPVCKVVECYNSKTNEWTEIHNLRFPRCFSTLFTMNDKLYLVGGAGKISEKDKSPSSVGAIDVWDWRERQWKLLTEMSIPRHGHALAYLGTQLIIIGGVTTIYMRALDNVESFCCERGAWIRGVAALPSPLSGHGAVTLPPASLM